MSKYKIGKRGGIATTRLYNIWLHMKGRCYRKTDDHYKWYGAKGVRICDEWLNSFQAFHDWAISNGYEDHLTIDRVDCSGNYEPSNCRWVDHKTQCNNRKSNILLTINGKTHNIQQWSELTGVKYATIYQRYLRGEQGKSLIREVV